MEQFIQCWRLCTCHYPDMHGIHVVTLGLFACTVPSGSQTSPGAGAFGGAAGSQTRGTPSFYISHSALMAHADTAFAPSLEVKRPLCPAMWNCNPARKGERLWQGLWALWECRSRGICLGEGFFCYFSKQNRLRLMYSVKQKHLEHLIVALKNIWYRIFSPTFQKYL